MDLATRYFEFKLLKSKLKAYKVFIEFKFKTKSLLKRKIKYLKLNYRKEYINKGFKGACFIYSII